jgi:hypothetical protein
MTTDQKIDTLIKEVEDAVQESLSYFEGAAGSELRIDIWTPREVLCHMIYWHEATTEGMESVAAGGDPYRIYASTDEMNARAVGRASGKSVPQFIEQAQQLQDRLVSAARAMPDPNVTVLVRGDGSEATAVQRLERIANHWRKHIRELREAEKKA